MVALIISIFHFLRVAEETERAKRANEDEVTRLRAAIRRSELRIHSLESQLQQKARSDNLKSMFFFIRECIS